jgi:hypothetical protein
MSPRRCSAPLPGTSFFNGFLKSIVTFCPDDTTPEVANDTREPEVNLEVNLDNIPPASRRKPEEVEVVLVLGTREPEVDVGVEVTVVLRTGVKYFTSSMFVSLLIILASAESISRINLE